MKKVKVISISALGIILVMLLTTYLYMDSNNKDSMYYANAKEPLEFETAYNSSEVTHPSVINLNKKISGYKYWMANTPYVKSNALTENPHIFASNDLVNWEVPKGLVNPLDIPT
ncbi:MAG: hypothetical protein RR543_05950, partial [Erysipelotrichales bacterium]